MSFGSVFKQVARRNRKVVAYSLLLLVVKKNVCCEKIAKKIDQGDP